MGIVVYVPCTVTAQRPFPIGQVLRAYATIGELDEENGTV